MNTLNLNEIHDLHRKTEGASEFANLLLDAMGNNGGLSRGRIADIYESYVQVKMREVESLMDSAAA